MSTKVIAVISTLALISGCAVVNAPSALQNLRDSSMSEVRDYAQDLAGLLRSGTSREEAIEITKKSMADSLKDPEGARFRNLRIKDFEGGAVVCGEINGKNSYGAYVGYQRFVASHKSGTLEDADSKYQAINDAANAGFYAACVH